MQTASVLLLALVSLLLPVRADAGLQLGLGPVDEIEGEGSAIATAAWLTDARHPWEFILGHISSRNDADIRTPSTMFISASKRFTWNGWFVQSGIAFADADNEVLSEHFQFQTGVGYDFGRYSVSLRHLSNANTGGRNRGETFLLFDLEF